MAETHEDRIDLKNLKQRELLILVHSKVEEMDKKIEKLESSNQSLILKVNTMETKAKVWGSLGGIITFIISIIVEKLFKL
jgi:hypothetical protein